MSTDNPHFKLDEIREVMDNIDKAIRWGMILPYAVGVPDESTPASKKEKDPDTTTSSLLYDGRPPRKDVKKNLKEISKSLQQVEFYPYFKPKQLEEIIKKVIGDADSRTVRKHLKCITDFSEKDTLHGVYDVRGFCAQALK